MFFRILLIQKETLSSLSQLDNPYTENRQDNELVKKGSSTSSEMKGIRQVKSTMRLFKYNHRDSEVDDRKNNRTDQYECSCRHLNNQNLTLKRQWTCRFIRFGQASLSIEIAM
jgi:hypothetical protein